MDITNKLTDIINIKVAGNPLHKYLLVALAFLITFFVIKFVSAISISQLKKLSTKTKMKWDDFFVDVLSKNATWFSLIAGFYASVNFIKMTDKLQKITNSIFIILITFIVLRIFSSMIKYWFNVKYFNDPSLDVAKTSVMRNMLLFIRTLLWVTGLLFILDNMGFDITTAVAGLGIGGMAVALAGQNILSDVFSYFTIFFDKPFEVGDFIIVDPHAGNVQHIGIKTTRLKSLQGEQLVFGNSDLLKSCIQNYKKMQARRIATTIGVTYETQSDKLKKIPDLIRGILQSKEQISVDRVHFKNFGDFSLNFEFVYFVLSSDYIDYMNIQEIINYELFDTFAKEKIDFAYPTQTLHLNQASR